MSCVHFKDDFSSEIYNVVDAIKDAKQASAEAGLHLTNDQLIEIVKTSVQHADTESMSFAVCMLSDSVDYLADTMKEGIRVGADVRIEEESFGDLQMGISSVAESLDLLEPDHEAKALARDRRRVLACRKQGFLMSEGPSICLGKTVSECLKMGFTKEERDEFRKRNPRILIFDDDQVSEKSDEKEG